LKNGYKNSSEDIIPKKLKFIGFAYIIIAVASEHGHANVLEWWKNNGIEFSYSSVAIESASFNGHINVLEWWKNSGYEIKHSKKFLERIANQTDVLDWWNKNYDQLKIALN